MEERLSEVGDQRTPPKGGDIGVKSGGWLFQAEQSAGRVAERRNGAGGEQLASKETLGRVTCEKVGQVGSG